MSPREFQLALAGFEWRHNLRGQQHALFTAYLLNALGAKDVTPADLYPIGTADPPMLPEERARQFRETVALMGPEAIAVTVFLPPVAVSSLPQA